MKENKERNRGDIMKEGILAEHGKKEGERLLRELWEESRRLNPSGEPRWAYAYIAYRRRQSRTT